MRSIAVLLFLISFAILADAATRILTAAADENRTAIIADGPRGIVRVMAGGREVARFDAAGLHVRNEIEYGGSISDTGVQYFDERAGGSRAPQ
ncbi:hypothetical protein Nham_0586 [Nitrobacter hamburgensis X14]|uniref:Uncharacterized protein n=1 Tax=Nitrobacter hamburgensis (strain DSM 10229 / NCIMB 13809 / X14) TaxID=323097 RepID=Q1QQM2_NITHX|nr:hypothetical protein [Nitrobacter hamburgensis]ABE61475.1 hypothetical protein Nham_0586 [Nitrobacter hamburgensis X14]